MDGTAVHATCRVARVLLCVAWFWVGIPSEAWPSDTLRLALALLWLWTSLLLGLSSTFPLAKRTAVFAMGIVPLFASHLQTMSPNAPFVLYGTCIVNALLACVVT